MTNTFLQAVALLLPMKIERVFWDGDILMLFSAGWSFQTESAWRVSKGGSCCSLVGMTMCLTMFLSC